MSEMDIACANFIRAMEKHDRIVDSRTKSDGLRDIYKDKTKKEVLNGKNLREVV